MKAQSVGEKVYLGDSVYACWTPLGVVLTTENGEEPTNTIYMEPEVLKALIKFVYGQDGIDALMTREGNKLLRQELKLAETNIHMIRKAIGDEEFKKIQERVWEFVTKNSEELPK